jgi:RNA polymerase sigma-70 factor (ECF subfamily)
MSAPVRPADGEPNRKRTANKDCELPNRIHGSDAASSLNSESVSVGRPAASEQLAAPLRELEDAELVALLATGRQDALTVLDERHSAWIMHVALDVLRDRGEARDMVQDIFLILCERAREFNPKKSNFRTWILCITRHHAIDRQRYLRARNFYKNVGLEDLVEREELPRIGSWLRFAKQEREYLLEELMRRLSPMRRRIIEMRLFEGMSSAQVAEQTGKSVSSVDNAVSRGINKLKRIARRLGV